MRLHFELCLPAIKIADMLGVSRHTINADIQWLYEKMVADIEGKDFNGFFGKQLVRLETQRTRLMSYLSEAKGRAGKRYPALFVSHFFPLALATRYSDRQCTASVCVRIQ